MMVMFLVSYDLRLGELLFIVRFVDVFDHFHSSPTSDPLPLEQMYNVIDPGIASQKYRLVRYRGIRGSSSLEGFHRWLADLIEGRSISLRLAEHLLSEHLERVNIKAGICSHGNLQPQQQQPAPAALNLQPQQQQPAMAAINLQARIKQLVTSARAPSPRVKNFAVGSAQVVKTMEEEVLFMVLLGDNAGKPSLPSLFWSDMRETWNVIVAGCIETDDLAGRITPKTDKILADHFPSLRKTIAMQQTIASVPTAQQVWH